MKNCYFENTKDELFIEYLQKATKNSTIEQIANNVETRAMYDDLQTGYRTEEYVSWYEGFCGKDPAIMRCYFPGNLLNPAGYSVVATFSSYEELSVILQLFASYERAIFGQNK